MLLVNAAIVFALVVLNGFFAMSELAVVSARKSRLEQMAKQRKRGAQLALKLAENPTTFLSTVQIGIPLVGIFAGAIMGYYGGWTDILLQRFIEIWGSVPFLFLIMIIASIINPSFWMLVIFLVVLRSWMAITYQIRGEFYREKTRDYVAAAIATGEGSFSIMFRHILPNALTPIITFAPFAIVATIVALVSLDFLGYGLPPPTPSWGELLQQAKANLRVWHLVVFPLSAIFVTLQLIVFVGEAVREAFDPKVISRLR